jgi:hypothetical protein
VTISSRDETAIEVFAGAASLAASIAGSTSVAVSIGFAMAMNRVQNNVAAYLANVDDVATTGAVSVTATNAATIHSTVATASMSVAIGGSTALSFSGGGAIALNSIATDTNAFIEATDVSQAGSVSVTASASSAITAETLAVSLSIGVGGDVGGAASFGASVAVNEIGHGAGDQDKVQAYISGGSIKANGALTVSAASAGTISAIVAAGSAAVGGGTAGVGISGAGAGARNSIAVRTAAFLGDPDGGAGSVITVGAATISASNTAAIRAIVGAASLAAGLGGAGVAVTNGVSV